MEKAQNMFVNEQGKTHEENSSNEYFINPIPTKSNWEMNNSNSLMDQNDGFESALSSMVSSPTATNSGGGGGGGENNNIIVLRELIGRLGSICNNSSSSSSGPGDIISSSSSPHPINNNYTYNNTSANTSCYSTPLNSPPKLNNNNNKNLTSSMMMMLMMMENGGNMQQQQHFPKFSTDPAFAQRAATFSSFANNNNNTNTLLSVNNPLQDDMKFRSSNSSRILRSELIIQSDSMDNSPSVSDHHQHILPPPPPPGINSRKRKSIIPRGAFKGKDIPTPAPAPAPAAKDANVVGASASSEKSESSGKRSKSDEESSKGKNIKMSKDNKRESSKDGNDDNDDDNSTKDYIHVRARRGQATDAHSLAERVRREKISERMKLLQDLVPGCNKVTGKAVMLDEIINYVQSLQRQVEFLSMKLATVNPRMDLNMEAAAALMSKDMFQPRLNIYPPSDTYPFQSQPNLHTNGTQAPNNFNVPVDNFSEPASQMSTFWEDDLHSIVQMGFGQHQTQNFHGTVQMKVEL